MYPLHILTAYLLTAFGILAFICRVWGRAKPWHGFFGRCFMYTVYWGYATVRAGICVQFSLVLLST